MIRSNQSEFDRFARRYEADLHESLPAAFVDAGYFASYKVAHIARRMRQDPPSRVLDFGCGIGLSLPLLWHQFPSAALHGFDVSSESLVLAGHRCPSALLSNDLGNFGSGSMDAILAANVFHHIPRDERVAALAACGQLLSERGRVFLFEHNPLNPLTRVVFERCAFDRDAEMLEKSETLALVRRAGLTTIRSGYTVFFPPQLSIFRPLERLIHWLPLGAQYCIEIGR